ncbi:conserved hypothetical protein [Uncinocarpus reesii 1704]|uniref:DUF1279 domain-containing protein n=1 Tax=Uncinocarpus reesii (strain UAMH 1704) TaxID=336963 RepID=C4JT63_UNCRE|nr:uncharacterized protein UREG_05652 [Uncinocarpus reesii 1704]EEP80810.1 conserved hypothetical protein [Uncinocarpus reesii 1704]
MPPRLSAPSVGQFIRASSKSWQLHPLWSDVSRQASKPPTIFRPKFRATHAWAKYPLTFRFPRPLAKRVVSSPFSAPSIFRFPPRASRRTYSTNSSPSKPLTFSERMRKLSREYGWSALGVYLFLSALDFPFCFAAVRLLGVERIGHYEQTIVESVKSVLGPIWGASKEQTESLDIGDGAIASDIENTAIDHGVIKTEGKMTGEGASTWAPSGVKEALTLTLLDRSGIWTQLALAYAVHKSLIFLRVPLTAAVTPKVVKTLRSWGWNIGKRKPKKG